MSNFHIFKKAVAEQFDAMSKGPLFRTAVSKDGMKGVYLDAFPNGTNEVYRERREFDCTCCMRFIEIVGNVVSIQDGNLISIWDNVKGDPTFEIVARRMAEFVKSQPVVNEFLHYERVAGTDKSFEKKEGVDVKTWEHFFVPIPHRSNAGPNFVCAEVEIDTQLDKSRSLQQVFLRGLRELTKDSVETVQALIYENNLYKGEENKQLIEKFLEQKKLFEKVPEDQQYLYAWTVVKEGKVHGSVLSIRNNSIGTLLQDLSEGKPLEDAVGAYEFKVSAGNFKRSTALVTQKQIDAAKKDIEKLGLTSALVRRFAVLPDISINDIIFADRKSRSVMKDSIFGNIPTKPSKNKTTDAESISIAEFISDVVPGSESIEVFFDNSHVNNLVSVVAPSDPKAPNLLKWDNGFSWAYNGDVTDSIKERVKKAGGNVTGDLCCRLSWTNHDDLDLHMQEPDGTHIFFGNKIPFNSKGQLDVDMNAGYNVTREPVENIFYPNKDTMKEGVYVLFVHNYQKREAINVGFTVEMDYLGQTRTFNYEKAVRDQERVVVAQFSFSKKEGIKIFQSLPMTQASKTVWNLKSMEFHPINLLMLSPNYWGENRTGNKHYMFMIDGCRNDGQVRGFFNEYLRQDLYNHRKVLEIVGSRMLTDQSDNQLSGLGFSSTQRNKLLARVKGSMTRTMEISF
jgi:hypothetical protein